MKNTYYYDTDYHPSGIASADDIKKMFNNFYGTACDFDGDFAVYKETADA